MAIRCVWKNVMSIRGLFALEFPVEMSSMTFPLSGWLIPFEIPAMLLWRVSALVNWNTAPAAALHSAPLLLFLPRLGLMTGLAACRLGLMLCLTALLGCGSLQSLCLSFGLKCFLFFFFFEGFRKCQGRTQQTAMANSYFSNNGIMIRSWSFRAIK